MTSLYRSQSYWVTQNDVALYRNQSYWVSFTNQSDCYKSLNHPTLLIRGSELSDFVNLPIQNSRWASCLLRQVPDPFCEYSKSTSRNACFLHMKYVRISSHDLLDTYYPDRIVPHIVLYSLYVELSWTLLKITMQVSNFRQPEWVHNTLPGRSWSQETCVPLHMRVFPLTIDCVLGCFMSHKTFLSVTLLAFAFYMSSCLFVSIPATTIHIHIWFIFHVYVVIGSRRGMMQANKSFTIDKFLW